MHLILVTLHAYVNYYVAGRIMMEIYRHAVPKTADNFVQLCTGERGVGKLGKPLHYKGSAFHRYDVE